MSVFIDYSTITYRCALSETNSIRHICTSIICMVSVSTLTISRPPLSWFTNCLNGQWTNHWWYIMLMCMQISHLPMNFSLGHSYRTGVSGSVTRGPGGVWRHELNRLNTCLLHFLSHSRDPYYSWMHMFSVSLSLWEKPPATGWFPDRGSVMWNFYICFTCVSLNMLFNKETNCRRFETSRWSCYVIVIRCEVENIVYTLCTKFQGHLLTLIF